MTAPRSRALGARLQIPALLSLLTAVLVPRSALAEKILFKGDDWQVYTDGRVGAFMSYVHGDGPPVATQTINGVPKIINDGV